MSFLAWRRRARAIGARIAALRDDERSAALEHAATTLIARSLSRASEEQRSGSAFSVWLDEQLREGDVDGELRALAEQHSGRDAAPWVIEHLEHGIDPRSRVEANRYATPSPVAAWMARAALGAAHEHFSDVSLDRWLALDPACGTGALLVALARERPEIARSLYGVERDAIVAKSAVVYLRAALSLPDAHERIVVDDALRSPWNPPRKSDGLIVLANPPYATDDAMSEYTRALTHGRDARSSASYRAREGERAVRNSKWLDTAQLRFLRWIHGECDRHARAVAVIALGHSWVDHPTFVTVRRALCESFAEVSVLDLHGAARHGLHTPDGERDQNVFDIQQGLSLLVLVKREAPRRTRVRRADLWGTRAHKLAALARDDVRWSEVDPRAPDWRFAAADERRAEITVDDTEAQWAQMPSLSEVFDDATPALITGRDSFVLGFSQAECETTARWLASDEVTDEAVLARIGASRSHVLGELRRRARERALTVARWIYRPWDERFAIDDVALVDRARRGSTMDALRTERTLAIVTRRQSPPERAWNYLLVVDRPVCDGVLRADPHGTEVVFTRERLDDRGALVSNVRPAWLSALAKALSVEGAVSEERAFAYVVGCLCDDAFRQRFQRQICREAPRIERPSSARMFDERVERGAACIATHTGPVERASGLRWHAANEPRIERVRWSASEQRMALSRDAWIEGVTEADVQWTIGARRPALRWLEDREGIAVTDALIAQYERVLARVRAERE